MVSLFVSASSGRLACLSVCTQVGGAAEGLCLLLVWGWGTIELLRGLGSLAVGTTCAKLVASLVTLRDTLACHMPGLLFVQNMRATLQVVRLPEGSACVSIKSSTPFCPVRARAVTASCRGREPFSLLRRARRLLRPPLPVLVHRIWPFDEAADPCLVLAHCGTQPRQATCSHRPLTCSRTTSA